MGGGGGEEESVWHELLLHRQGSGEGAGKAGLVTQYVLSSHGTLLHVVTC